MSMKVVACVPIKMNNERTPGKNTRALSDGTPLCQLMFNTLSSVKAIDDVFCFCSNLEIENYFSGRVKFLSRGGY